MTGREFMTLFAQAGKRCHVIGTEPKALSFPHFPTRFQAVIWRNWADN